MSTKSPVFKQELKFKGFFNYGDFYNYCYNWLKDEGYSIAEDKYSEKVSGAKEIDIEWKAEKKINDYYKNIIELKWKILGLVDAEVQENGKPVKTQKGEVKLKFAAVLESDYSDEWEASNFQKMMRGIYDKYIVRTTTDEFEDRLGGKAESLVEDAKAFLNLSGKR